MGFNHNAVRAFVSSRGLLIGAIALLIGMVAVQGGFTQSPRLAGTIDYAKSGNTLELLSALSPELPVTNLRLLGIQAPDMKQKPWGPAARDFLDQFQRRDVWVEAIEFTPDAYGRLWADVWVGKESVNQAVVAAGHAFVEGDRLPQLRYGQPLIYAQEYARLLGLGIWSPEQPMRETPQAFRDALSKS